MPPEVADVPRPEAPEEDEASPPRPWAEVLRRFRLRYVLAAVPPLWMASLVRGGTPMQYNDYWFMVSATFEPDGGLDVGGLFTFLNHHPVVVPKLVYWLNAQLAAGSNLALGWFVILLTLVCLFLVGRLIDDEDWPTWAAGGLVVSASFLLFSREGAWNFFPAMSGTAWITANALVLAALAAQSRGRPRLALGFGVVASLSYGTGLLVWPALIVQRMVQRRSWRPDWPLVGITALVGVAYVVLDRPVSEAERLATGNTLDFQATSPGRAIGAAGELLGSVFDPSAGFAEALGLGWVVVGSLLAYVAIRDDARRAAPWVALLVYSTGAALLIGRTRGDLLETLGQQSRYTSIAALFWVAIAGLVVLALHHRRIALVPLAALAVAAGLTGSEAVDTSRDFLPAQAELAASMHLDLADGFGAQAVTYPRVAPMLEELGHYPFDGSFDGDCGLAGQEVSLTADGDEDGGRVASGRPLANGRGVRLQGWVAADRADDVDCVLLIDQADTVVGYGAIGVPASDLLSYPVEETFAAVAPLGARSWRAAVVYDDGTLDLLGGRVPATDLQGVAPVGSG